MSRTRFLELCFELTVDPSIALENENVKKALKDRDDEAVERILKEIF
jgi:hypothetical protein